MPSSSHAVAAFVTGPGRLEVREIPRPTVRAGLAVVDGVLCGVCGTDLHNPRSSRDLDLEEAQRLVKIGHGCDGRVWRWRQFRAGRYRRSRSCSRRRSRPFAS